MLCVKTVRFIASKVIGKTSYYFVEVIFPGKHGEAIFTRDSLMIFPEHDEVLYWQRVNSFFYNKTVSLHLAGELFNGGFMKGLNA